MYYHHLHDRDEETKALRGRVASPGSQNQLKSWELNPCGLAPGWLKTGLSGPLRPQHFYQELSPWSLPLASEPLEG